MSSRRFKNLTTYDFIFKNGQALKVSNVDDELTIGDENMVRVTDQRSGRVYTVLRDSLNAIVQETEEVELDS